MTVSIYEDSLAESTRPLWDDIVGVNRVDDEYMRIPNTHEIDLHTSHVRLALQHISIAECPRHRSPEVTACLYCAAQQTGTRIAELKENAKSIHPPQLGMELHKLVNEILAELLEERFFMYHQSYHKVATLHQIFTAEAYVEALKKETEILRMIGNRWLDRLFVFSFVRPGDGELDSAYGGLRLDAEATVATKSAAVMGVHQLFPEIVAEVIVEEQELRVSEPFKLPESPAKDRSKQNAYRADLDKQVAEKREQAALEKAKTLEEDLARVRAEGTQEIKETEKVREEIEREMLDNVRVLNRLKRMERNRQRKAMLIREQHELRRELRDVAAGRWKEPISIEDRAEVASSFKRHYGAGSEASEEEISRALIGWLIEKVSERDEPEETPVSVSVEIPASEAELQVIAELSDEEDHEGGGEEVQNSQLDLMDLEEAEIQFEEERVQEEPRLVEPAQEELEQVYESSSSAASPSELDLATVVTPTEAQWIPLNLAMRRAVEDPTKLLETRRKLKEHAEFVSEGNLERLMRTVKVLWGSDAVAVSRVNETIEKFNRSTEMMTVKKLQTSLDEIISEGTSDTIAVERVSEGRLSRAGVLEMFGFQWREEPLFGETQWVLPRCAAIWRLSCSTLAAKSMARDSWLGEGRGMTAWLKVKFINAWSDFYFRQVHDEIARLHRRLIDAACPGTAEAVLESMAAIEEAIKPYRRAIEALTCAVIEGDDAGFFEAVKRLQTTLRHQRIRQAQDSQLGLLIDLGEWL